MRVILVLGLIASSLIGCDADRKTDAAAPLPPLAARVDFSVETAAGVRSDPYFWLRNHARDEPAVLAYLDAENAYTDTMIAPLAPRMAQLHAEFRAWMPDQLESVAYLEGEYWYYVRYPSATEHPVYVRRADRKDAPVEVLVDGNARAEGRAFYAVDALDVSPDGRRLAWLEDDVGRRQYRMYTKNLETGEIADSGYRGVSSLSWSVDGASLYLVENDSVTLRAFRVRQHWPGGQRDDRIVYEEQDAAFQARVDRTRSDRFNLIHLESTESSELRFAGGDLTDPAFEVFLRREPGHLYAADHDGTSWVIRSNWQAPNFRILRVDDALHGERDRWSAVVPHRNNAFIERFVSFQRLVVVEERVNGLLRLRVIDTQGGLDELIEFDAPAHTVMLGVNREPDRPTLQYMHTSLAVPQETLERNLVTGEETVVGRQPTPEGFEHDNYRTWRVQVQARDGAFIPVTLVRHRDTALDGSAPLYQHAYGAYGVTLDPTFDPARISLLDRGFVYAIAHVRGSQALGRDWYEQGRKLNKLNTFNDFVDVTRQLVDWRIVDGQRVYAVGSSAGGTLIAAIANRAPTDYDALVAHVPFVDVVTSMLDGSLPLTAGEFEEWGDPRNQRFHDYMLTYSPYDNVKRQAYPAMLVTTGLHDSQVQYWEPAKWVARLRHRRTDDSPLLFRVAMEAGHSGQSGRFRRLEHRVLEHAFLLDRALGRAAGRAVGH